MKIYIIYNKLNQIYESVMNFRTRIMCKHYFKNILYKNNPNISLNDIKCMEVGTFDEESGKIELYENQITIDFDEDVYKEES